MPILLSLESLEMDRIYVQRQLDEARDTPWGTTHIMWRNRLAEIEQQIAETGLKRSNFASVAIIFDGDPVIGSSDIQLDFTADALDRYQKIVSLAVAARITPELAVRGPLPGADRSRLFIRDLVRGSMGFVLEEIASDQQELLPTTLKVAVEDATKMLSDLSASTDANFENVLAEIQPRMIGAIQQFAKVLHESHASARILGDENRLSLSIDQIGQLSARLNEVEVSEDPLAVEGTLLGILPDSREFELKLPGDSELVMKGSVTEELAVRYTTDMAFKTRFLLQPVRASVKVITTKRRAQPVRVRQVLEALEPASTVSVASGDQGQV